MKTSEEKHEGFFYLPENPEKRIPGELTIKDGETSRFKLHGAFYDFPSALQEQQTKNQIINIWGELVSGKVVLLSALKGKSSYRFAYDGSNELSRENYFIVEALIWSGIKTLDLNLVDIRKYKPDECLKLEIFSFSIENATDWISTPQALEFQDPFEKETKIIARRGVIISELSLDNGYILQIKTKVIGHIGDSKVNLKGDITFSLSHSQPQPLGTFKELLNRFVVFFWFVFNKTVHIKYIYGNLTRLSARQSDVKIYPVLSFPKSNRFYNKFLFPFKELKNNKNILSQWFKLNEREFEYFAEYIKCDNFEELIPMFEQKYKVFDHYVSHLYSSNNKNELNEDFIKRLLDACEDEDEDEEEVKFIKSLKKHTPSADRIKSIMNEFDCYFSKKGIDLYKLSKEIARTRNDLIHENKLKLDLKTNLKRIRELCNELDRCFYLLFLKSLGFSNDKINSLMEKADDVLFRG